MNSLAKAKGRYNSHKSNARYRGIEFNLTFEQWYDWWLSQGIDKNTVDIKHDGQSPCMCRFNDIGAYEIGNIYFDTRSNNIRDFGLRRDYSSQFKKVKTPDGVFNSRKEASEYYNLTGEAISWRCKNKPEWEFIV